MRWADGTSAGIDVTFIADASGRRGHVAWGPTGSKFISIEKLQGLGLPAYEIVPAPKGPAPA